MSQRRRGYAVYLLRLWQVEEGENALWWASLESPQSGERWGLPVWRSCSLFWKERDQKLLEMGAQAAILSTIDSVPGETVPWEP